ncbi:MAG TPA: hypothetical protein VKW06_12685, partial [Candidatus Angelobacter sp.]|nr:hypothetical protein [Candidatus Angelobacter sp.]
QGGEIDALDPGGFGAVTITKSITLDGGGGQVASVLVSGTNGIVVQAGPSDVVIIRNIRINGLLNSGNAGINGIRFLSGKDLEVQDCTIFGFGTNGVDIALGAAATANVINTVIQNSGNDGISVNDTAANALVGIEHTTVDQSGNVGIEGLANARLVVNNSTVFHAVNDGVKADAGTVQATVGDSDLSFNTNGFTVTGGAFGNSYGTVYGYNTACSQNNNAGGSMVSFGQNRYVGSVGCGVISPINPN